MMRQAVERYLIESTPVSRCLLGIGVSGPLLALALLMITLGQRAPAIAPMLDTTVLTIAQWGLSAALTVLLGLACWLWPRRHNPTACPGVELVVALCVGPAFTYLNCINGLYGAGSNLILLGCATVGLLLLNWRVMLAGITLCGIGLIACDLLIWHEIVPYAAAITPAAFEQGQPAWWWRLWQGMTLYIGLPVSVLLILALFASHDALQRRLARLAITDALTGLTNRRHFMARLDQELARQRRHARPLTVVAMDVDHFKRINDQHGHAKGDEALVALATTLSIGVRAPTDLIARLGGEEFALLLPDTALSDAQTVCMRLQSLLAARPVPNNSAPLALTISMGVVQCRGVDAQTILREADALLYRAKASGRDCMVCSVLEGPTAGPTTAGAAP